MNVASTVKRISRLVRSYRKPSSLHISVLTQNFTDGHLAFIFKHLKKLVYLKNLNIQAPNLPFVTPNGYELLGKMTTLKHLQKIDFNTSNCEHMTNRFLGFFTELLFKATSLQTIKLDIHQENFMFQSLDDYGIYLLRKGLRKLFCLKYFNLNLAGCSNISDKSLGYIYSGLKPSKQLFGLILNLNKNKKVQDCGLKDLGALLGMKPMLNQLELDFKGCELITDDALMTFKKNCSNKKYQFHSFSLNLSGGHFITDTGAKVISELIQDSHCLEKLSLNYHKSLVSNKTMSDLTKMLTQFKNLKALDLNFALCDLINDDGLELFKSWDFKFKTIANLQNRFSRMFKAFRSRN